LKKKLLPLFKYIFANNHFSGKDLLRLDAGITESQIRETLNILVREGLVFIEGGS